MDSSTREKYVASLLCPYIICRVKNKKYIIYNPTHDLVYKSYVLYDEIIDDEKYHNWPTDEDNIRTLHKKGLCGIAPDVDIENVNKRIETLKLELFNNKDNPNKTKRILKKIEYAEKELGRITKNRYSLSHLTLNHFADIRRNKFIISNSVFDFETGEKISPSFELVDSLYYKYFTQDISYKDLRTVARTSPWVLHWRSRGIKIFSFLKEYTLRVSQMNIINISEMYEQIAKCEDSPSQEIIDDDNLLDGWKTKREREYNEAVKKQKQEESLTKFDKGQEVFIPVKNAEEAREVNAMNTGQSTFIKQRRQIEIDKKGTVDEAKLPDKKEAIVQMARDKFMEGKR